MYLGRGWTCSFRAHNSSPEQEARGGAAGAAQHAAGQVPCLTLIIQSLNYLLNACYSDARRFDMEAALERASRDKRSLEVELERLGREGPQGIVQVSLLT